MINDYPIDRAKTKETPEQRKARMAHARAALAARKAMNDKLSMKPADVAARKIAKARAAALTDDDQVELYLAESGSLMNEVLRRIKKYMRYSKDPNELSRIALNLLEVQDKLKGNRTASRSREIKKTAAEIAKSNDMAMLIGAAVAKTPSDLAQIVVDKPVEVSQTLNENEGS